MVKGEKKMFYDDLGHCPICGKFCSNIIGHFNFGGLQKVYGICKTHGKVDLSNQSWSTDDFEIGEEEWKTYREKN